MKRTIFLVVILLLIPLLMGSWFDMIENNNLFTTKSNNLLFWPSEQLWGGGIEDSAVVGWYPVERWEVDTCVHGQTTDFVIKDQSDEGAFSQHALIVDTSLTIQGKQVENSSDGIYATELGWYIHPFRDSLNYSVKVKADGVWSELDPPFRGTANAITGDSRYISWNSDKVITEARIEAGDSYLVTELVRD